MLVYWLLFGFFAIGTLLLPDASQRNQRFKIVLLGFGAALIALLIGVRYEVGGDWGAYEQMLSYARYSDLLSTLDDGDPAYQLLNWVVARVGGEIWLVNLFCGAVFAWGLARLCRAQPDPWLAMLIAIPYLTIVVAMGYSRQAVAIGIVMAGLASLQQHASIARFAIYVAIAAMFHRTSVVALPLVVLASNRNLFGNLLLVVSVTAMLYDIALEDSIDRYLRNYVEAAYGSQGAAIRVAMAIVPAALFLLFRSKLQLSKVDGRLWLNFSIAAFGLLGLLFILPSSTVVDRLALYVLPLQLVVLSRVPRLFNSQGFGRLLIFLYAFAVQFVWLNYAEHAEYWLPYRFYPFGS